FLVQGEGGLLARYEGDIGAPPLCGNGDLDPEEECDDGNTASGDCCSSSCTLDPVGTACGPTFACSGFVCDGAGACEQNSFPDGTACNDGISCTVDECQSGVCVGIAAPATGCKKAPRGLLSLLDKANDAQDK